MVFNTNFNTTTSDKRLEQIKTTLGEIARQEAALEAGRKLGVAAEGAISPYPAASKKPLPLRYTRTVEAAKPYVTAQGATRTPGQQYPSKFKSPTHQRGFFGRVRGGTINVPYVRTGTLGKSFTSTVVAVSDGVLIKVGSNIVYAPLVKGRGRQAQYFAGTWTTLEDDLEAERDEFLRVVERALNGYLNRNINR